MAEKVKNILKALRAENKSLSEEVKWLSIENKLQELLLGSYASFLIKKGLASSVDEANAIVAQEPCDELSTQTPVQLSLNFPNFR